MGLSGVISAKTGRRTVGRKTVKSNRYAGLTDTAGRRTMNGNIINGLSSDRFPAPENSTEPLNRNVQNDGFHTVNGVGLKS